MLNSGPNTTASSSSSSPRSTSSSGPSTTTTISAISLLKFPFKLTKDQTDAVDAWMSNGCKGSIIYSTGTGKTEIAFECAKRACETFVLDKAKDMSNTNSNNNNKSFNILFLVPRIVLIQQNIDRLIKYGIPQDKIGTYFGERKEISEITISTYQSVI